MKKILFLLAFVFTSYAMSAQNNLQQKTDSLCHLVTKYFNQRNPALIYELTGEKFRKTLTFDGFKNVCEKNLFPLGPIKECVFLDVDNRVSRYKAVFSDVDLDLLIGLDERYRLETFLFRPFTEAKETKNYILPLSNPLLTQLDKEVDSVARPYSMRKETAGLSIGILKNGKIIFYGYGETEKGNKQVPDEHTIFEIGSITKTFTATLLADAVNNKKVKLEDPASKYLPDSIPLLEYEGIPVTLKTLSNQSSGIPRLPSNFHPLDIRNPYRDYDVNDLFSFYEGFKLPRKPGEKYEYSNLVVATLGIILERVYTKSYETLVIEKICSPLGMNDTRQSIPKKDSLRFAKGYNEAGKLNSPWDPNAFAGAVALRSTVTDLLIYAEANLGFAPAGLKKAMLLTHGVTFTDGTNKVGLGWHIIRPGVDEVLFHNGGTGGCRSYLAINPQKKFAVVLLANSAISVDDAGNALMKWLETN